MWTPYPVTGRNDAACNAARYRIRCATAYTRRYPNNSDNARNRTKCRMMRFKEGDEETTAIIAAELGLSTQRVLQIQATALRKCRDWCSLHGYRLSDLLDTDYQKFAWDSVSYCRVGLDA